MVYTPHKNGGPPPLRMFLTPSLTKLILTRSQGYVYGNSFKIKTCTMTFLLETFVPETFAILLKEHVPATLIFNKKL